MTTTKRRVLILGVVTVVAAAAAFNAVAWMHAYRMTHFVDDGVRTVRPESLSSAAKLKVLLTGVTVPRPTSTRTPADMGVDFEAVRLQARDGISLSAWHIPGLPDGGSVAMFHGYGACKGNLLSEARVFHELGWHTLLVDLRGAWESDGTVTTLGAAEAADVAGAAAWLGRKRPDQPLVLFGASMGAVAILGTMNRDWVEPDAIILECPYDTLLHTIQHRFEAMRVPAFPAAQALVFWGGVQHGFNGFALNPVDFAQSVRCPALLLHGERDPRVRARDVEAIRTGMRGPSTVYTFLGLGHESYAEARPNEYRATVARWFARRGLGTNPGRGATAPPASPPGTANPPRSDEWPRFR